MESVLSDEGEYFVDDSAICYEDFYVLMYYPYLDGDETNGCPHSLPDLSGIVVRDGYYLDPSEEYIICGMTFAAGTSNETVAETLANNELITQGGHNDLSAYFNWQEVVPQPDPIEPEPVLVPEGDFYEDYVLEDDDFMDYMESAAAEDIVEEIGETDFTTRYLIVEGSIVDPEHEAGAYGNIHLMEYDTQNDAEWAFAYYDLYGDNVVSDRMIYACDDEPTGWERDYNDIQHRAVFDTLDDYLNDPIPTQHYDIALLDTDVYGYNIDRIHMYGTDPPAAGGHGTLMYDTIIGQNAAADIISIEVMDHAGHSYVSALMAGILYASRLNVDVFNISMGYGTPNYPATQRERSFLAEVSGGKIRKALTYTGKHK